MAGGRPDPWARASRVRWVYLATPAKTSPSSTRAAWIFSGLTRKTGHMVWVDGTEERTWESFAGGAAKVEGFSGGRDVADPRQDA